MKMNKIIKSIIGLILPITLLLIWELAAKKLWLPPSLSAAPSDILINCFHLFVEGILFKHLIFSLIRIFISISIGLFLGAFIGFMVGQFKILDNLVSPFLGLLAPVPVVVWIPFVIMAFGTGEYYKVSLASLATFLIIFIHTYRGVSSISKQYFELSSIYEKSWISMIRNIYLPASLPSILTGIRIALAISWIVIFFVEFGSSVEGSEGLGWFINDSRQMGRVEDEYAGVFTLAIAGYLTDLIVLKIQRYSLRWANYINL